MDHITVCICTYKRPQLLDRLLEKLLCQKTEAQFTFSTVVVDNDGARRGMEIVKKYSTGDRLAIEYFNVPEKNIALARNTAIQNASGDYCAFIDDDEIPIDTWLCNHYNAIKRFDVVAVLGPVLPEFEKKPPLWMGNGKIFERPRHETGTFIHWKDTRTGNVIIKREIFDDAAHYFNRELGEGGEDVDFFRRLAAENFTFLWCDEAIVYEYVPSDRMTLRYFFKRAYLRGVLSFTNNKKETTRFQKIKILLKSMTAIILYILMLPFLFFISVHLLVRYLIKITDHFSRCLAILGIIKDIKRDF
ncbi:MAG: glycosyltransferase [Spirochaetales bacterium]|nr:glycosyltransferase [Spirochaetales bacterium]